MQRDRRVLQVLVGKMTREEGAEAVIGDHVVGPPEQAKCTGPRAQRKDVLAAQATPDLGEVLDALTFGAARYPGGVDGSGRSPDQEVGADAFLEKSLEHSDLDGAQAAPT